VVAIFCIEEDTKIDYDIQMPQQNNIKIKLSKGDILFFPSYYIHPYTTHLINNGLLLKLNFYGIY
jgi:ribosomal protein L16 Arg81 hydroxylase